MSDDLENPNAFPNIGNSTRGMAPSKGMTLRDWFAGRALAGFMGSPNLTVSNTSEIAEDSYRLADAMLAARGQS